MHTCTHTTESPNACSKTTPLCFWDKLAHTPFLPHVTPCHTLCCHTLWLSNEQNPWVWAASLLVSMLTWPNA